MPRLPGELRSRATAGPEKVRTVRCDWTGCGEEAAGLLRQGLAGKMRAEKVAPEPGRFLLVESQRPCLHPHPRLFRALQTVGPSTACPSGTLFPHPRIRLGSDSQNGLYFPTAAILYWGLILNNEHDGFITLPQPLLV